MMLQTGDLVFDTTTGASVQVLEKIEAWGYISYRVFNPATGKVYKAAEEQLNIDSGTNAYCSQNQAIIFRMIFTSVSAALKYRSQTCFLCLIPLHLRMREIST